jgi:hypothetical protein
MGIFPYLSHPELAMSGNRCLLIVSWQTFHHEGHKGTPRKIRKTFMPLCALRG